MARYPATLQPALVTTHTPQSSISIDLVEMTSEADTLPQLDLHQHVWTTPLIRALAARQDLPFVRYEHGTATLYSAYEPPFPVDLDTERPRRRLREDGLDRAVVALSSPIGIEALPRQSAKDLIDAHLGGVQDLGSEFAAWGPLATDQADPRDVDALLQRGCVGVSLPAAALAPPTKLEHLKPILERIAQHQAVLFVHPGPGRDAPRPIGSAGEPPWWRALTDYVFQMQAAWLSFATVGRPAHPDLTIVFAMLAGGAPLLSERLLARDGPPIDLNDPRTFYDTSSYGPVAVEAMARRVGLDQLVYGSDRAVIEPVPTARDTTLRANAAHLLPARTPVTS